LGLFEAANQLDSKPRIPMDRFKYMKGNVIYGFNFAPDLSDGCENVGHVNPIQHGALRIDVGFASELTKSINALILCEYDSLIQIGADRNGITDYN
jgi:hypothetical protein